MSFMGSLASWYSFLYGFLPLGLPIGFDETSEEITCLPLFSFLFTVTLFFVARCSVFDGTQQEREVS